MQASIAISEEAVKLFKEGLSVNAVTRQLKIPYSQTRKFLLNAGLDLKMNVGTCRGRMPKRLNGRGYIELFRPEHPMANCDGYVKEHVLKACEVLGRPMTRNEVVHHINGNKTDNRNCNLLICTRSYHSELHWRMGERWQKEHFKD